MQQYLKETKYIQMLLLLRRNTRVPLESEFSRKQCNYTRMPPGRYLRMKGRDVKVENRENIGQSDRLKIEVGNWVLVMISIFKDNLLSVFGPDML